MADLNTYEAVGTREDLSDLITNIAPSETPLFSAFGKATAKSTKHEWLEDSLAKPKDNAQVEGFELTVAKPEVRQRLDNVTQIFSNGYGVTATQEAVDKAGVKSEISYQMTKAMKEHGRDIEYALLNNLAKVAGAAATARKLKGVPGFLTTNVIDSTGKSIDTNSMNDVMQKAWQEGGNPKALYCSGANKRKISALTSGNTKYMNQKEKRIIDTISVYESDFGVLKINSHRQMSDDFILVLDMDYFKTAYLRKPQSKTLPETTDAIQKTIISELTLEVRAEKASGIIQLKAAGG